MADEDQQPVWPMVPIADRFLDSTPCPTCGRVIPAAHDHFHGSGYSATNFPPDAERVETPLVNWQGGEALLRWERPRIVSTRASTAAGTPKPNGWEA